MHKAYDIFLQTEVTANLASENVGFEPYRYECAHCGEEVRLAAADSISVIAHFRHRSGNNDVECDNYLGQYGAINIDSHSRKSRSERVEFYFDNSTKMFYLCLRFSDVEISTYEQLNTTFELRATSQEKAFYSLPICSRFFDPDSPKMIPVEKFSHTYFISNTHNGIKSPYEVFKKNGSNVPTFFKLQISDSDFKAKLVRSSILYTNVPYFIAYQSKGSSPWNSSLPSELTVDETFRFGTTGREFLGKVLTIKAKTASVEMLLKSWGYQLEASETLMLLWPPSAIVDEVSTSCSGYAYLYSSFELQAHGNINVHSEDLKRFKNGVTRVTVNSRTRVHKKNAEMVIDNSNHDPIGFVELSVSERQESVFVVPDDISTFLFNHFGTTHLSKGQTVLLTQSSIIRRYLSGYLVGRVYSQSQEEWTSEQVLKDILAYYKRAEAFTMSDFDVNNLSETAYQYIERCEEFGLINSAAKRFIEEARL